jgi:hypothetical protein
MIINRKPQLIFDGGFDDREALECRDRGYRSHVWVEFANGERFPVVFYDIVRLQQELESAAQAGNSFIGEPGLIVLPEVTKSNMENAVRCLAEDGFFETLRPVSGDAAIAH